MNGKILIVEDDYSLASTLREVLEHRLYTCELVGTLKSAYRVLEEQRFDLLILDRAVTDGDTLEIVQYIQDQSFSTRVLFLSQINTLRERIRGLELGADDYLGKPFAASEFLLRVENLLFKQKIRSTDGFRVGPLILYPTLGQVKFDGALHSLRRREMEILHCLCRHQQQVITKDQLISEVWGNAKIVPTHNTLDVYIRRIRLKLEHYHQLIKTVRGYGYTITYPGAGEV